MGWSLRASARSLKGVGWWKTRHMWKHSSHWMCAIVTSTLILPIYWKKKTREIDQRLLLSSIQMEHSPTPLSRWEREALVSILSDHSDSFQIGVHQWVWSVSLPPSFFSPSFPPSFFFLSSPHDNLISSLCNLSPLHTPVFRGFCCEVKRGTVKHLFRLRADSPGGDGNCK